MEKENKKTIEIPFGVKDSELYKFEYTIPEGYEARIEDGKVIVTKKESEDERIRKILIHIVKGACDKYGIKYKGDEITGEKLLAYLEKQKEVKWSPSECEMGVLYKLCYVSNQITDEDDTELTRLYQDLKREYFNGHSFENMFPKEKQKDKVVESDHDREQPETDMKSPFTGGKVTILSREEEVTFRGEKVKILRKYYRCKDTGREFTDSKLDDDMMWSVFRAYCEKKGMTSFNDIMLKQEQPEVDLEEAARHVYESWMGGTMDDVRRDMAELGKVLNARKDKLPEIELDKFTEKIKTFQGRYKYPEIISIKGAMAFMARMFYQYPNVARLWYDRLPKTTMD